MRKILSLFAVSSVLVLLSACASGPNAITNTQGPVGSGDNTKIGNIYVQNVVIVKGEANTGTVVATISNSGNVEDQLVNVLVENPAPKAIIFNPTNEISIPAKSFINLGFNTESPHVDLIEFSPRQSSFVKIKFVFKEAGIVDQTVLVVPNEGIYTNSNPISQAPKSAAEEGRQIIAGSLSGVSVTVLNGTRRSGFARSTGDYFELQGMKIVDIADAENKDTAQTQILYAPGNLAKAEALAKLLTVGILVEDPNLTAANIVVTLGNDAPFNLF